MKFPAKFTVRFNEEVTVDVDDDGDVKLTIEYRHVYLDPGHARRLAKALKKAAKKASKQREEAARW